MMLLWLAILRLDGSFAAAPEPSALVRRFPLPFHLETHSAFSRLILSDLDPNLPIELHFSQKGFQILFKGANLLDLGLSSRQEKKWKEELSGLTDIRLKRIHLREATDEVVLEGEWRYPEGKVALAHPQMEAFDYQEKEPHRTIIDFWVKKGPTLLEAESASQNEKILSHLKHIHEREKDQLKADEEEEIARKKDENWTYFCEAPLSEKQDLFLKFYPVHPQFDFSKWLPSSTPDSGYLYSAPEGDTKEAKHIRLAIELFETGKPALAIKTLDFFEQTFPRSRFHQEMQFLRGNALNRLGYTAEAEKIWNELSSVSKNTPASFQIVKYLAGRDMSQGKFWHALQKFYWLIDHYSDDAFIWIFHLGAAECLYAQNSVERAAKEYRWIIENGPSVKSKAEALFRTGDLYLKHFQYEQALASYHQGVEFLEKEKLHFPSFLLNRGETLYQLGQYDRASEEFEKFLKLDPMHPEGWRASYRLGEIWGRKPVSSENQKTSRQWFSDAINRYPFGTGATLSRLRLAPCGDHGGLSLKTGEDFFKGPAEEFKKKGPDSKHYYSSRSVYMKDYPDHKRLAYVRSLISLAPKERVIGEASKEYQKTTHEFVRSELSRLMHGMIRVQVLALLGEGKKLQALSFYSQYSKLLPRLSRSEMQDLSKDGTFRRSFYLLKLAQAAEEAGLGGWSSELYTAFLKKTKAGKEEPSALSDDQTQEIKASEEAFTKAMGIWIRALSNDKEKLNVKELRELLVRITEASPFYYPKEVILAQLDEREGRYKEAIRHASLADLSSPSARIKFWIASLMEKDEKSGIAINIYKEIEDNLDRYQKYDEENNIQQYSENILGIHFFPTLETLILKQGAILEASEKWTDASATYERGIDKKLMSDQIFYRYAKSLMKNGSKNKGIGILKRIIEDEDKKPSFWKALAKEALNNAVTESDVLKAREGRR